MKRFLALGMMWMGLLPGVQPGYAQPIYRCGNSYSTEPRCAAPKAMDAAPVSTYSNEPPAGTVFLYRCSAYSGGGLFWSLRRCADQAGLTTDIFSVPAAMSFQDQVVYAQQQWQARQPAPEPVTPVARESSASQTGRGAVVVQGAQASWHDRQCRALDAQIHNLDAMARHGGGPQKMDHIARQRREVRDRMFRLHC